MGLYVMKEYTDHFLCRMKRVEAMTTPPAAKYAGGASSISCLSSVHDHMMMIDSYNLVVEHQLPVTETVADTYWITLYSGIFSVSGTGGQRVSQA